MDNLKNARGKLTASFIKLTQADLNAAFSYTNEYNKILTGEDEVAILKLTKAIQKTTSQCLS